MYRQRAFTRKANVCISILLGLSAVLHPGSATSSTPQQTTHRYGAQSAAEPEALRGPTQVPGQEDTLQSALNMMVRQALSVAGWRATTLGGRVDEASLSNTGSALEGAGKWQIEARDEQDQPLRLEGSLNFSLNGQAQNSQGFTVMSGLSAVVDVTASAKGELRGTGVDVAFQVTTEAVRESNALDQKDDINVHLVRDGKESNIKASGTGQIRTLAYNLQQQVSHSQLERDGRRADSTRTVTLRVFGKYESEMWGQSTSVDQADRKKLVTANVHSFQYSAANKVTQYVDDFSLVTPDNSYKLKESVMATATAGGDVGYNVTLIDRSGNEVNVNSDSPTGGRRPGLTALSTRDYGLPDWSVTGQSQTVSTSGSIPDWVVLGGLAAVAGLGFGLFFVGAGVLVAGAVGAGVFEGIVGGALFGTGLAGGFIGGTAGANALRNADPYFVSPDARTGVGSLSAGLVEITRVTGGLINSVAEATAPTTNTSAITPTLLLTETPQYDDDPVPFVGGSLPPGAQQKGDWTWDPGHSYGAMLAHTQVRSDGPQKHYFIHASSPLTISKDTDLIQYVYLDPQDPPREIYMQFYTGDGDGEHRAYWGDDLVQTGGERGRASLYPMGSLPEPGGWVRLQIAAPKLGLVDRPVSGVLYGAYGGRTWWGPTTTSNRLVDNAPSSIAVQPPQTVPSTTYGTQIAFRLAEPAQLTVEIANSDGKKVRTLAAGEQMQAGYQVITWDAKDDSGTEVPDVPYKVRFAVSGNTVAERPVTITPFVANIAAPGAYSLVRGNQVPVVGEAYGQGFSTFKLEYGKGTNPSSWETIKQSSAPVLLPTEQQMRAFNPGNIASWNVGIDEYKPWDARGAHGLSGIYTLRLTVTGKDGREASDSLPVVVGRLAHTAEGGTITSPDRKARLLIPALATEEPFAIMGLVAESELDPNADWQQNLPANAKLLGEIYEVLPPGETFRRPATLELPYSGVSGDRVGILLGDGTLDGWRYVGGRADPGKGTVSVAIDSFGGGRAMVGVFALDHFGEPPPDPAAGARLSLDATTLAPVVQTTEAGLKMYADMENSAGEYEALDLFGTRIERVAGPAAGTTQGNHVLKVTRLPGGERLLRVLSTPYDAAKYPFLSFDYRLPTDYAPDLLVRSNGVWLQIRTGTNNRVATNYFMPASMPSGLVADDAWHHSQIDLLSLLRAAQPLATGFQVDEVVIGQINLIAYMQVQISDSGEAGSAYYLDNFAVFTPLAARSLSFTWAPQNSQVLSTYSYALDQVPDTLPDELAEGAGTSVSLTLPAGAADGVWYFHLRGQDAGGKWGDATHVPVLVDRQPPETARPNPAPGGAGNPDIIVVPLSDQTSGIEPGSLRVRLNGQTYSTGKGVTYDPLFRSVVIVPRLIEPAPKTITNGQKVDVVLVEAADYAGNKLASPYEWSFTADRPDVTGASFEQLTTAGGHSPALSPDGSILAFVSARSGKERVWVIGSEAGEGQANSAGAAQLTSGTDAQADPAWSPDGSAIAYISDASGLPQVWVAARNGSGPHALTAGAGAASSPTWLPDGTTILFVRDGNIWSVSVDGSGQRAITSYPERPVRSVRAQPNGSGRYMAVGFKLYEEDVQLYDLATDEFQPVTHGGRDREPAWLNDNTLIYTAPAGQGASESGTDGIWQVGTDGEGSTRVQGSAAPGTSDMEPSVSADGSMLAVTSTRGGERNIWVLRISQLSQLRVSPASGVLPGETVNISYSLPTTSTVTMAVEDATGKVVRLLTGSEVQSKGTQQLTWDGTNANGQAVAPGSYVVHLSAKLAGGEIARYATVLVSDPAKRGTLHLEIQQWAGVPARGESGLHVLIYPQGDRTAPTVESRGTNNPAVLLPAGHYDAVVEYNGNRHMEPDLIVAAGKTTGKVIDLGLCALEVVLQEAPGRPVQGQTYIAVSRTGDTTASPLQTGYTANETFLLSPGNYDLSIQYGNVRKQIRNVKVRSANTTHEEINLDSGLLHVTVYSKDGELAAVGGRVGVSVFDPETQALVTTSFSNPTEVILPAGRYDVRIDYSVRIPGYESASLVGGVTSKWLRGVEVRAGQMVSLEHNFRLTPVTIKVEEAKGKVPPAGAISFFIYPGGERVNEISAALTNTAHLELPAGAYDVVTYYKSIEGGDEFNKEFQVDYGRPVEHTMDLGLGHVVIEVSDSQGQLTNKDALYAAAYPAGQRDTSFSFVAVANPLDLPVRADARYDIVVRLSDGRKYTLIGQQVKEGETITIALNSHDFKPQLY